MDLSERLRVEAERCDLAGDRFAALMLRGSAVSLREICAADYGADESIEAVLDALANHADVARHQIYPDRRRSSRD